MTREMMVEEHQRLKVEYGRLFDDLEALLFRHDPMEINFGHNTDEYDPEVETILPRLPAAKSAEDVSLIVQEEFKRWFGRSAGSRKRYAAIGTELWELWLRHQREDVSG